ncbi:MAG: carbohydrate ABC transporter permease [Anaerolineae bacterium]|nr:carbohydrate ABC transporter permease [Anaerolineae bacterium]
MTSQTQTAGRKPRRRFMSSETLGKVVALVVLALGAVVMVFPLAWMFSSSLKPLAQIGLFPPVWIPREQVQVAVGESTFPLYQVELEGETRALAMVDKQGRVGTYVDPAAPTELIEASVNSAEPLYRTRLRWENYLEALTVVPFGTYALNTAKVVFGSMLGMLLSTSLVAYGFSRFRAPGLSVLFLLLLSTTMLPHQVTLIPTYILFSKLGWIDTLKPLIVPSFFAGAYDVFLLRQYFMTIPLELDDAAKIDGCGTLGILFRILLPMAKPAIATLAIFHFMWAYNDFFNPLIYLHHQSNYTIALGLQSFNAFRATRYDLLMAASLVTVLPCILLFFFAQRIFIQGIVFSGVKG